MNWTDFKAYAARGTWKNTLRKNGLWLAGRAALYFFLIVLGFVFLYPFLFMISRSLMSYNDIVDATVKWFPKVLSPGNYALAFQTLEVPLTGLNSLIVTLLCTLGHVVACAFIGYGLGRYSYGFTKWIFAFVVQMCIRDRTAAAPRPDGGTQGGRPVDGRQRPSPNRLRGLKA